MHFHIFAIVGALAASAIAAPTTSSHVLHERRDRMPKDWMKWSKVNSKFSLPVRIGMTQSNLDKGHDLLMEVSRHDSPKFGQHYTAEEVNEIFAPSRDRVDAVRGWLESAGIESHRVSQSANKQWIQFDAKTKELESLLQTKYYNYKHIATGKTNIGCDEYVYPHDSSF